MKGAIILLTLLLTIGCSITEHQKWYNRLNAVEGRYISDSAKWALSADTNFVRYIEQLDSLDRANARDNVERMRRQDSEIFYYETHK